MALIVADRVQETTNTVGTGTLTLNGAVLGYQSFAAIGNANTTYYTIVSGTDWETGVGTYTSSGTTLSRDTVLSSSASGSKISVASGSVVFCDYPATQAVYESESGAVSGYAITGGSINNTPIGSTTPNTGNFTTITGQTEVLRGTGQNLITQSGFSSGWTISNVTATTGQTDPFGGTAAVLLNDGTSTNIHSYYSLGFTAIASVYTFSIYAKAGTSNYIGIYSNSVKGAFFDLTTGAFTGNINGAPTSYSSTNVGNGWWRLSITFTATAGTDYLQYFMSENGTSYNFTGTSKTVFVSAPQVELGSTVNTYIPTTTTAVYGTPTLSFSGVSEIGLLSTGALYLQPAGTGALQAQATTSSAVGGNARGANAVDWQTARSAAGQVASGAQSVIGGGTNNVVTGAISVIAGGGFNGVGGQYAVVSGGAANAANLYGAAVVGGQGNLSAGYFNFIGGGFTNSATSGTAVTSQATTTVTSNSTAVTLSASNANIKVGQLIAGTGMPNFTYVAAISGTALTLSQNANASGSPTLSFFTPYGTVVGGGNNQATGSYSVICGGGDAGTAANRNVASGDYSAIVGGRGHVASGAGSFIGGGGFYGNATSYTNTASGIASAIVGGLRGIASGEGSFVGSGDQNQANGNYSCVVGGNSGTARSIRGNAVFPACIYPIASIVGTSQAALLILARQTTDATATVLCSDATAASTNNQVILPNNSAYYFKGSVIANVTGAANGASWSFEGSIMRGANAASTVLIGTPILNRVGATAGATAWTVAITADTTNGGLRVTVTGVAATTIRWVAKIETTEVTY